MPRPHRPSELEAKLDHVGRHAQAAVDDLRTVLRRLSDWSAGASSGGTSGPTPKNQVSRPTEAAALSHDEHARKRDEIVRQVLVADAAMRQVDRIRREVMAPPPRSTPVERGLAKCCNPRGCPDDAWAVKAGRCDACYQYRWRTDRDRSPDQPNHPDVV